MVRTPPIEQARPGVPEDRVELPPSMGPTAWLRWMWRSLTSMRTAVILLALVALAAVPGSLLPQRGVSSDPGAVIRFTGDHPALAPWLDRLGLFGVYSSPWFAATYILLLVSMTGCVIPRCLRLWRSTRAAPPPGPRSLHRLPDHRTWQSGQDPEELLAAGAAELVRRGFRVRVVAGEVRGERGYLREMGNLVFHLSLLVLLLGIGVGQLFGFEGRVALAEGAGFSNVVSQYDEFNSKAFTDVDGLEPLSMTLKDFEVDFETAAATRGEPRSFAAQVDYSTGAGTETRSATVAPNSPLDVNETKFFLTGHGYAPKVTVRDGRGKRVFGGPVIFLPNDPSYASDGVVKVPDAQPVQLGFEGFFLPTAEMGRQGPYSAFPDDLNPQLVLTAYTGDLGLSSGRPQSVYSLDKAKLTQIRTGNQPFARAMSVGETMTLPGGQGSVTFDGVSRFANFQIAYDPGKEISLAAALMLLAGLTISLFVRRRRIWIRADGTASGTIAEVAMLPLTRRGAPGDELDALAAVLGADTDLRSDTTRPTTLEKD